MSARTRLSWVAVIGFAIAACGGSPATSGPTAAATQAPVATQAATPAVATTSPTAAAATTDPFAFVSAYEGTYTGSWRNVTFGSTGPAEITITLDRAAGTISFAMTLGGNVFGQPTPAPETLTAKLTPGQPLSFTSKTFGPTTVSADVSGASPTITFESLDVPSDRVKTFTATATIPDPSNITLFYGVTFRDGTAAANGNAALAR